MTFILQYSWINLLI